ncbi:histidine kinase [Campylobacter mucosalis]|uniref:histidine kinase n=1 Tax=Campylobacter mucosalis TaxID=202 RepID=UPI0014702DE5|nr:histidine kinase [Campylobacter mucosalis]
MINYKKLGLKNFKNGRYDDALKFFSLAYEQSKDENLLFFIMLCSLAKQSPEEAKMLFEYSFSKDNRNEDNSLDEILEVLESKNIGESIIDEQDAISYEDFKRLSQKDGFKSVFESVMFSTKVMISNKDDFLEFVHNLIKNDFLEMGITYLESAAMMFAGDERIDGLLREIKKRQSDENLH